jgi:hypothetical protein
MSLVSTSDVSVVAATALPFANFALTGKSPVNHTHVDFSPFLPLKAKIDCITFSCNEADLQNDEVKRIAENVRDGTLKVATDRKSWAGYGHPWMAVHDPSLYDLQYLVERFWNSKILRIEFAVDARLPPGSNDLHLLEVLKGQLRHCLYPQAHDQLPRARRKYYDLTLKQYRADGLGTPLPGTQIIWESPSIHHQLAAYIKTTDEYIAIKQPWVRIEARLTGSGPARAGLDRVGSLPHFAANLRGYLAPMFWVASGFKNAGELAALRGTPGDPWSKWGAQWDAKGKARLAPDADANRFIGDSFNEMRSSLMRLKPPTAVAHRYEQWIDEVSPY